MLMSMKEIVVEKCTPYTMHQLSTTMSEDQPRPRQPAAVLPSPSRGAAHGRRRRPTARERLLHPVRQAPRRLVRPGQSGVDRGNSAWQGRRRRAGEW